MLQIQRNEEQDKEARRFGEFVMDFLTDDSLERRGSDQDLRAINESVLLSTKDIKELFKARDALKQKTVEFGQEVEDLKAKLESTTSNLQKQLQQEQPNIEKLV